MPYFNNNQINLLFIHIPKTGGTSLEIYFSNKYNIKLDNKSLFTIKIDFKFSTSLQHLKYSTILENKKYFNINLNNLKKITIVRNPYDRLISDLFYFNLINEKTSLCEICTVIKKYLESYNSYDGHKTPQYEYITINNKIIDNIIILKTENLNENMHDIGYDDFDLMYNTSKKKKKSIDYLNMESIRLINKYYDKDFSFFNYVKIDTKDNNNKIKTLFNKKNIILYKKFI